MKTPILQPAAARRASAAAVGSPIKIGRPWLAEILMIADHLGAMERRLPRELDGPLTASELFGREFCEAMFGAELRVVANARVVDSSVAQPVAADLLLCLAHGPRLRMDGEADIFLAESVVAAITVLPSIDAESMARAVASARAIKALRRNGMHPAGLSDAGRAIPCHLVAFDGPAQMEQVHVWLKMAYRLQGFGEPELPPTGAERQQIASPALDGVFVLGRGFLGFDNSPLSLFDDQSRLDCVGACWAIGTAQSGSLLALFLQLQLAATALAGSRLDSRPYLTGTASVISAVRLAN